MMPVIVLGIAAKASVATILSHLGHELQTRAGVASS